jgi:hypothetical protein
MFAITEVTLRNFRGFENVEGLRLAPLTFLVGPNSSGKSSIADALLFMAQSGLLSLQATNPIWSGPLVDLGSFKDTVFRHDTKRAIEIGLQIDATVIRQRGRRLKREPISAVVSAQVKTAKDAPEGRLKRLSIREPGADVGAELVRRAGRYESFRAQAGDKHMDYDARHFWAGPAAVLADLVYNSKVSRRHSSPLADVLEGPWLSRFAQSFQRVSSGRDPPQRSYLRNAGSTGEPERVLLNGIDATALEAGRHPDRRKLRDALVEGLLALGIASDLEVSRLSDYHTAVRLKDNVTSILSNLADVGYGASQVIPVLEGCAAPGPGPLFVEQPEIHLHPRAQGELAQILCIASRKRQMIVETHSEHMINRARRLVAEGSMQADDVAIQYIDRNKSGSYAVSIGLDDAGDFTRDWPDGFFDERYRETMKIAEAQAKRADE